MMRVNEEYQFRIKHKFPIHSCFKFEDMTILLMKSDTCKVRWLSASVICLSLGKPGLSVRGQQKCTKVV